MRKQAGFNPVDADFWSGMVAPAGTPGEVVARLNAEVRTIAASSSFKSQLAATGLQTLDTSPEQFAAFIASEMAKWADIAKFADVKAD